MDVQVGKSCGEVVDRDQQEVLDRPGRCLHRGRCQGRLAASREEDAVDPGRLGAPEERAHVLGVLERVERENERGLRPLAGTGEHAIDRRVLAWSDGEGNALVAVEARDRRERPAFDFDDRNPEVRRVKDDALERLSSLGHDEQTVGLASRDERLLDRSAAGYELLVRVKQLVPGKVRFRHGNTSRTAARTGTQADPASTAPRSVAAFEGSARSGRLRARTEPAGLARNASFMLGVALPSGVPMPGAFIARRKRRHRPTARRTSRPLGGPSDLLDLGLIPQPESASLARIETGTPLRPAAVRPRRRAGPGRARPGRPLAPLAALAAGRIRRAALPKRAG